MHLGEDEGELEHTRRYQPTRTPCPVYTCGNEYLTATKTDRKPRECLPAFRHFWYDWQKTDSYVTGLYGWVIWRDASIDDGPGAATA